MIDFQNEVWEAIKRHPFGAFFAMVMYGIGWGVGTAIWHALF